LPQRKIPTGVSSIGMQTGTGNKKAPDREKGLEPKAKSERR
jgi:hypothetical protein